MPSGSCLVLAPHLEYPARNGADILVDRTCRELSARFPSVDLLAADGQWAFSSKERSRVSDKPLGPRSRTSAGLRTVVLGSHYYTEKFLTPAYRRAAERLLRDETYDLVMSSYITTAAWAIEADPHAGEQPAADADPSAGAYAPAAESSRCHATWTHNDEFRWFADLRDAARSPAGRWAAQNSLKDLEEVIARIQGRVTFVHVSDEDRVGYERRYPGMRSVVAPIGVDLPGESAPPLEPGTDHVDLLFVGSLGVRMNLDALTHFSRRFQPALEEAFADRISLTVVGSRPSAAVRTLCEEQGWTLRPDVPDDELHRLYVESLFAVLPFEYATGAKLKFLGALSHGVPVLGTRAVAGNPAWIVDPNLLDDDPSAWVEHIRDVLERGIAAEDRERLRGVARRFSWAASTDALLEGLRASGCL